ncbi:hypothetical protein [Xanthomonas sacchari]|nr:hypothetical protein [Xanthomonas sacchari]
MVVFQRCLSRLKPLLRKACSIDVVAVAVAVAVAVVASLLLGFGYRSGF